MSKNHLKEAKRLSQKALDFEEMERYLDDLNLYIQKIEKL